MIIFFFRYKISTSSGGGYCDCGDKEAWKNGVFCDIHIKGELAEHDENPLEKIPQDLVRFYTSYFLKSNRSLMVKWDNYNVI